MTQTASPDLIHTPFGFDSTAAEVIADIDLSGKRAIVTGASSGIGVETARALASAGAEVTLAVRDTEAGQQTAKDIFASTGSAVHVGRLDLADEASAADFAASWTGPLHLLINNAGVMALEELTLTPDGWELQFSRHMSADDLAALRASGSFRYKTIEQGAATSVLVATSPQLEGIGGRYFEDCNQAPVLTGDPADQADPGRSSSEASPVTRWTPTTRAGSGSCPSRRLRSRETLYVGPTLFVTGSSRGLGRHIAEQALAGIRIDWVHLAGRRQRDQAA